MSESEHTLPSLPALGIDVAKDTFDVRIEINGKAKKKQFGNTSSGYMKLSGWLTHLGASRVHACLEATGSYADDLAEYLHQAGQIVSVVNPARIKGYAQSQMKRSKTDQVDAEVIRHFCYTQRPEAWTPPSPEIKALRALVRRLEDLQDLQDLHTQEANRLHSASVSSSGSSSGSVVRGSIEHMLELIDQHIDDIRQRIRDHVKCHPELARQVELIESIPGLGQPTAVKLVAEFMNIAAFEDARGFAAWAGVTPSQRQSGSSVRGRPRMSKIGNASVRGALYWPAVSAMRYNPIIIDFIKPMRKAKKNNLAVIVAVMRKLLHLVYGVIKHNAPFDPYWLKAPNPSNASA